MVGPNYFSTIGIPLLLGRETGVRDTTASPHVCVINEAFAKKFFTGRNPIGHHVTEKFGDKKNVMEIVGVAKDVRDHRLRGDVQQRFYVPADQGMEGPNEFANIEIRTTGDPEQVIGGARKAILSVSQDLPIDAARPLVESLEQTTSPPRMVAPLGTGFGCIALLL